MRRNNLKLCAAALLSVLMLGTSSVNCLAAEIVAEGPAVLYTDYEEVKLYNGPGEEYTPITSVDFGTELLVDAMTDNAWYRLHSDGETLWVEGADCSVEGPLSLQGGAQISLGDGVDSSQVNILRAEYNKMPASCQALFSGITFYLDQSRIYTSYFGPIDPSNISGMYQYGKEIDLVPVNLSYSVLHECGHHIDYMLGKGEGLLASDGLYKGAYMYSHSEGFKSVFDKEWQRSGLLENHPTKDPAEYFAQAFSLYIQSPEKLLNLAPYTYAYMASLVASLQ